MSLVHSGYVEFSKDSIALNQGGKEGNFIMKEYIIERIFYSN